MNNMGDEGRLYSEFLTRAALFYSKHQILEALVVSQSAEKRHQSRDAGQDVPSACAIPGLGTFLYALSLTITSEYYPDLHRDRDLEHGTTECILFSSSDAVFGFKTHSGIERCVELMPPALKLALCAALKRNFFYFFLFQLLYTTHIATEHIGSLHTIQKILQRSTQLD